MRHDTQVTHLGGDLFAGYAMVRGYRSLRGWYSDLNSLLELRPYAANPGVPVCRNAPFGLITNSDVLGLVSSWKADEIGLWTEFKFLPSAPADLIAATMAGSLYFCAGSHPDSAYDPLTGYHRYFASHFLRLLQWPSFRPNKWKHPELYAEANVAAGGDLYTPPTHDPDNEMVALGEPLQAGWNEVGL